MDPKVLFKKALEQATATIQCIQERHFKNETPCTDWDCQALVNHMLYEVSWVPEMLRGKTVAEVGSKYDGDLLKNNHIESWQKAVDKATEAINQADLNKPVHLSRGDATAGQYLQEIGSELFIHAWDAAQSLKCSLVMENDMAQAIHHNYASHRSELLGKEFDEPFDVPEGARLQTKLLALVGRREPSYATD